LNSPDLAQAGKLLGDAQHEDGAYHQHGRHGDQRVGQPAVHQSLAARVELLTDRHVAGPGADHAPVGGQGDQLQQEQCQIAQRLQARKTASITVSHRACSHSGSATPFRADTDGHDRPLHVPYADEDQPQSLNQCTPIYHEEAYKQPRAWMPKSINLAAAQSSIRERTDDHVGNKKYRNGYNCNHHRDSAKSKLLAHTGL